MARRLPFQENPKTGDARVSGSGASLAGLEKALTDEGPRHVELAIRRVLLLHGVVLSIGGMPLIYPGDELDTLNDYAYQDNPSEASDGRWVHRPRFDWGQSERRHDAGCTEGHIYGSLRHLIGVRRSCPAFAGSEMQVLSTGNPHAFAYVRGKAPWQVVVVTNFTEQEQSIGAEHVTDFGLGASGIDLVREEVGGSTKRSSLRRTASRGSRLWVPHECVISDSCRTLWVRAIRRPRADSRSKVGSEQRP